MGLLKWIKGFFVKKTKSYEQIQQELGDQLREEGIEEEAHRKHQVCQLSPSREYEELFKKVFGTGAIIGFAEDGQPMICDGVSEWAAISIKPAHAPFAIVTTGQGYGAEPGFGMVRYKSLPPLKLSYEPMTAEELLDVLPYWLRITVNTMNKRLADRKLQAASDNPQPLPAPEQYLARRCVRSVPALLVEESELAEVVESVFKGKEPFTP